MQVAWCGDIPKGNGEKNIVFCQGVGERKQSKYTKNVLNFSNTYESINNIKVRTAEVLKKAGPPDEFDPAFWAIPIERNGI